VLHLAGARDEFYPPARVEDYAARLSERAQDVEFRSYDDAAHELTPAMREDVRAWLEARIEN
jgi:predicted esterase